MPQVSSRFRILRTLGDGGMGSVYLAELLGEGGFEKKVALKRLKPELSQDPESVGLFMREAKLAAQLNHPNIVQVFDGGLEEGNLYLVLEYVDGGDLEDVIRTCRSQGRVLSPASIALIGAQVCEALCCLFELKDDHGAAQVQAHRDISPSNVLLTRNGVVKLSDFGVVRLRESKTAVGRVRGKWEYFPPELVRGTHDQRGDLFALGITLYKLAALRHPFEAPTPQQHFERACRMEPAPISGLPPALWGIISRALCKDPKQRYQTAEEMGADLDAFVTSCHERISPRYLAREIFSPPPATGPAHHAPPPQEEAFVPTQVATDLDLFKEFDAAAAKKRARDATDAEQELRQFEEIFGMAKERTPSSSGAAPKRESPSEAGVVFKGRVPEAQLRTLYGEFARVYLEQKNQPLPVSFEQLAVMVEQRRSQIQQKFPGAAIAIGVAIEGAKVLLKVKPVPEPAAKSG